MKLELTRENRYGSFDRFAVELAEGFDRLQPTEKRNAVASELRSLRGYAKHTQAMLGTRGWRKTRIDLLDDANKPVAHLWPSLARLSRGPV